MLSRTSRTDDGQIRPHESAFSPHQMAIGTSLFSKQRSAALGISLRRGGAGGLAERTHVCDDLPRLSAIKESAWHRRSRDAFGDIAIHIGVSASVEEDASGQIRPKPAFSLRSVTLRAVRTEYFGAGGPVSGCRMRIADRALLPERNHRKQQAKQRESH